MKILKFLLVFSLCLFNICIFSQTKSLEANFPVINVLESNCPSDGYFFISSAEKTHIEDSYYIAIVDNLGVPIFFRSVPEKINSFKLQPNGYITFNYCDSSEFYVLDSSYNNIDTISVSGYNLNDADIILTESGEIFLLGFEYRSVNMSLMIEGGDPNAIIKESVILIYDKNKSLIFTWKSSDHFNIMDVNKNSPFVDLTAKEIDYIGLTDIEIDSDTCLLLSCRYMDEITKIDIRTGEIIWRFGGKHNEFNFINDNIGFSQQSSIQKLKNGDLLIFDNGLLHEEPKASIVEYNIDEVNKTVSFVKRYSDSKNELVDNVAGIQNLSNNNFIVSRGNAEPSVTEFYPNGTKALELDFSDHSFSNKINKSEWQTNLFTPVTDSINFGMWEYTIYRYILILRNNTDKDVSITSVSNYSEAFYFEQTFPINIPAHGNANLMISYYPETITVGIIRDVLTINSDSETQRISQQVKMIGYRDDFVAPSLEIYPKDAEINVPIDTIFYFKFSEPLRFQDNKEIDYTDLSHLIELKKGNIQGADLAYNALINTNKDLITVIPKNRLENNQTYYLGLKSELEDYYDNNLLSYRESLFTTESATLIQHLKSNEISIYPNPTVGNVNVESENLISEIIIFDVLGETIFYKSNLNINNYQLDFDNNKKGLYILKIKLTNNASYNFKILKE